MFFGVTDHAFIQKNQPLLEINVLLMSTQSANI